MNGVLLMTYGSPDSLGLQDVRAYLERVRGGREPGEELAAEFQRRYRVIGGSPLIEITRRQADALAAELGWPAEAGMRFSEPSIGDALARLTDHGARRVAAIVLSPQYSPLLMGGYGRAIEAALATLAGRAPLVLIAPAWHLEPAFVEAAAGRIVEALSRLPSAEAASVPVLLTAHSLPRRVAEAEPAYLAQLEETAIAIASAAGLGPERWQFCWQSAGHEPGEWMKPDVADVMPQLAAAGQRSVLVAPVQFLADHLEILYDLDVGAREQAEAAGLRFSRTESLNADARLVAALASVARSTLAAGRPGGPWTPAPSAVV